MSLVGKKAPEWAGIAYLKGERKPLKSADYRGKWLVLYWYPADFTWLCPTEINGMQALLPQFATEAINVIGVSTDSFYSHLAWFANRQIFPKEITHPVLADKTHSISQSFGVLKEEAGVAYRASIVIDDQNTVRAQHVNDIPDARSPAEVLRTVQALQSGGFCPPDWKKGDKFAA